MTLETLKNKIMELVNCEPVEDIVKDNLYLLDNIDSGQDFVDALQGRIEEQEIIYYSKAIKYLEENDSSLRDSLYLAYKHGYSLENLSSEVLATLLYQDYLQGCLDCLRRDIVDTIEEYLEEMNDEE